MHGCFDSESTLLFVLATSEGAMHNVANCTRDLCLCIRLWIMSMLERNSLRVRRNIFSFELERLMPGLNPSTENAQLPPKNENMQ